MAMSLGLDQEKLRLELERLKSMSGQSHVDGLTLSLSTDGGAGPAPPPCSRGAISGSQFRIGCQGAFEPCLGPLTSPAAQRAFESLFNRPTSSQPTKPQAMRPSLATSTSPGAGSDRELTDGGASSGQPSPRDLDLNVKFDQSDMELPESSTANVQPVKRERDSKGTSEDDETGQPKKKLRLTREQSQLLEQAFTEHSTLNPKQKSALARQLGLRPRQVEVWFQNRRARTKLKQTEVDCEVLKKCCETLTEENRRLQKELQELKAMRVVPPCIVSQDFCVPLPAATLTMCPSCERITMMDNRGGSVVLGKSGPAGCFAPTSGPK